MANGAHAFSSMPNGGSLTPAPDFACDALSVYPLTADLRRHRRPTKHGFRKVDNVAHVAYASCFTFSAARMSIADEECSFGSPTIAIRPPYRSTVSRSGRFSTE